MTTEGFWKSVVLRLEAGKAVYVAMVVANTRNSPGTLGARLLIDSEGNAEGTIGGGIMEVNVMTAGRRCLRDNPDAPPELQRLVHRKNVAEHASGLICAGEQANLNLVLQPDRDIAAIRRFCSALDDQSTRSASLVIDASGVSANTEDGEGGRTAITGLTERDDGYWCYREWSVSPRRIAIVGAGHCGRALARLAVDVGYWVDVFDTRPEALQEGCWPDTARRHLLQDDAQLQSALQRKPLTTVVVMTASVLHDIGSLAAIARDEFHWLGVMGSKAKIHAIRRSLREQGIAQELIDAIHGPIGLPIKSDTPAEIAVSVMAQLLADSAPSATPMPRVQPPVQINA